jgi:hypothetical protein
MTTAEVAALREQRRASRHVLVSVAAAAVHDAAPTLADTHLESSAWDTVVRDAEAAHLTPLLHDYLQHQRAVPAMTMRQLHALRLRQLARHRERTDALAEILDVLERAAIDVRVLKGAALAWIIYPSPELRPMGDVDLLVPRPAARAAQALLEPLGFRATQRARRFGRNAHHLPPAIRSNGATTIAVEIHVDALSRDTPDSIAMHTLTEPGRPFCVDARRALALGHVDMLRHLAHHVLEPAFDGAIRLLGVIDLLRYANIFHDEIDWARLGRDHPFVLNVLRCLHDVVPLPGVLRWLTPPPTARRPARAGEIMRPLRSILAPERPLAAVLHELFRPPEWWMHAYYAVPAEKSLTPVRLFRHPSRVARWLGLRAVGV